MSDLLREKLSGVKLRQALVSATTGAAAATIALIAIFAVTMFIDYWFDLSVIARALLLICNLGTVAYLLVRYAINPLMYGLDEESLALAVERSFPEIASRVIATIQLTRPDALAKGSSKALVRAMIDETEQMVNDIDFGQIVKLRQLIRFGGGASLAIVLAIGSFVYAGDTNTALFKRAILIPAALPKKTSVYQTSGDFAAAIGDDVSLNCLASGVHPSTGVAHITYESGRTQDAVLTRADKPSNKYEVILASVQESFTYRLNVYDDTSAPHKVEVFVRPAVKAIACTEIFPSYANLPALPHNIGDLSFLVGSQMKVAVTATKTCRVSPGDNGEISTVKLLLGGDKTQTVPLPANPEHPELLVATVPLPADAVGFSIQLVDDRGLKSKDSVVYPIEMVEDRPPTIEIVQPDRKEILTTAEATPQIEFQAEDDLGVATVSLHYQVDGGASGSLPMYPGTAGAPSVPSRLVHQTFAWPIDKVPPVPGQPIEGTQIDYWLEVTDTCSPKPHMTESEHYSAKIVSAADKKAELLQRLNEFSSQLDSTRVNQLKANEDLRDIGLHNAPSENNR
jgi:hypothetical protein